MSNLVKYFTPQEKKGILEALERLFICQNPNRPVNDKTLTVFLGEIIALNYTADEIIKGINALKDLDLYEVKLGTIKNSIYQHSSRVRVAIDVVEYTKEPSEAEKRRVRELIEKVGLKSKKLKSGFTHFEKEKR